MHNLSLTDHVATISRFLSQPSVSTLFQSHPNDIASTLFQPPQDYHDWWTWSATHAPACCEQQPGHPWLLLLQYYSSPDLSLLAFDSIPKSLRNLIDDARNLAIPRCHALSLSCIPHPPFIEENPNDTNISLHRGMSPKKAHEVSTMSQFIQSILSSNISLCNVRQIVDIGAGQAYLSRILRDQLGLSVLALDWSPVQSAGATKKDASNAIQTSQQKRRRRNPDTTATSTDVNVQTAARHPNLSDVQTPVSEPRPDSQGVRRGSLTYVTTKIDTQSLLSSTQAWITDTQQPYTSASPCSTPLAREPEPVLFVALHACGSLTVDILRAFVSANLNRATITGPASESSSASSSWTPRGAVVVGCCYNMMRPEDFPLSRALCSSEVVVSTLTQSHLQLAAQVPSQWTRSEESLRDARLAMRKIVWRALLEDTLREQPEGDHLPDGACDEGSPTHRPRRLGRLSDSAYANWETFVRVVQTKLGSLPHEEIRRGDPSMERRIEVFHALRCIVGPVVESLILLDRLAWVREELESLPFSVELVNLFDQAKGSGRNVAIVIRPSDVQPTTRVDRY